MQDEFAPEAAKNQTPFNLAGCRWTAIPGAGGIRILIPNKDAADRLGRELDVPGRLAHLRSEILQKLKPGQEAFGQRNYGLGDQLFLSVSMLTTRDSWRGGWVMYHASPGSEEILVNAIRTARAEIVANLRKERFRGSPS